MGLQKDGGLWEQAWKAVLKRGAASQDLRKVKGHATDEDVEAGISTAADKIGLMRESKRSKGKSS